MIKDMLKKIYLFINLHICSHVISFFIICLKRQSVIDQMRKNNHGEGPTNEQTLDGL